MGILSIIDPVFGEWFNAENKKNILALFVVVKFFAVIGFVSFLVWTIRKNAASQDLETSKLLDELENDTKPVAENRAETENNWERDADWWK